MNSTGTLKRLTRPAELGGDLVVQPARKGRRLWAVLRAVLATFAVSLGLLMVPAAPAQAATDYGTREVCFQAPYSINGTTSWGTYDRALYIDVWANGQANQLAIEKPDANGCLRQDLPAGYWWRYRVYHYENSTWYNGQSDWTWVDNGSYAHLGTVYVSAIRG